MLTLFAMLDLFWHRDETIWSNIRQKVTKSWNNQSHNQDKCSEFDESYHIQCRCSYLLLEKVHLICANLILLTFLTTHNIVENLFVLKIGISTMHTWYLLNNSTVISDMFHLIIWRREKKVLLYAGSIWIFFQALHTLVFFQKWDWEAYLPIYIIIVPTVVWLEKHQKGK